MNECLMLRRHYIWVNILLQKHYVTYCKVAAQVTPGSRASKTIPENHLHVWRDVLQCRLPVIRSASRQLDCAALPWALSSRSYVDLFSQSYILTYLHKLPLSTAVSCFSANPLMVCALCVVNRPVLMMCAGAASQPVFRKNICPGS